MSKLATSISVGPFTFTDCSYDAEADIAYLSIGKPRPAISWESPEGHLVRLDPATDELIGLTILHLLARLGSKGRLTVTFPEHVLAAAVGLSNPVAHKPVTVLRAQLEALCA